MVDPPILIVGSGAMASLFAALLSSQGLKVRMLGTWKENLEAINKSGVQFIDQDGRHSIYQVEATNKPEDCAGSKLAIVLVKSYQTVQAAKRLAGCLSEEGIAITLQNGLGNFETLVDELGVERVVSGVTTLGATLVGPGAVRMGGIGSITIGNHAKANLLEELFTGAGLETDIVADPISLIWGKLVINASINPLTGLLGVKNGSLLENAYTRNLLELITVESAEVAGGAGIELPYADAVAMVETVVRKTAENYSSMYIDFQRGGPTEIDAINGSVVRAGVDAGVATYYNHMLWLLVKAGTDSS